MENLKAGISRLLTAFIGYPEQVRALAFADAVLSAVILGLGIAIGIFIS